MACGNAHSASHVLQQLRSQKSLVPTQAWLSQFLSTQRAGLPVNALVSTASFRLLAADIKTGLDAESMPAFPPDVVNVAMKQQRIAGPIIVQVLDIEDMSRSRWSQVEDLEAEERGERMKGREIIRVAPSSEGEDGQDSATPISARSNGPHKLLLEDVKGMKVYGIELKKIDGVNLGMNIGSKLMLRDVVVARGVVLLQPQNVTVLGGKVEQLHTHWKANRQAQLKLAIQSEAT